MMMTQSYHGSYGSDYDSFGRVNYRLSTGASPYDRVGYDRAGPYSQAYYDTPHPQLRSDYNGRPEARALIHEHVPDTASGHPRRRIQVACSRCRRRKIKCTGDPGDGSGCSACRSAGAEKSTCTFNRVGSHNMTVAGVDMLQGSSAALTAAAAPTAYAADSASSYSSSVQQNGNQRPSLPTLQTRGYPEYASYDTSPVDDYTYASSAAARHSSFSSNYGAESFRPYHSGSVSTPSTTASMYYEPGTAFSFGTLQHAPGFPPNTALTRLPSASNDAFSSLNMSSLHSSLPTQTVQERRLPIPYIQQQHSYATTELPQIRPLSSLTEPQSRAQLGGIYSRSGISWSNASSAISREESGNRTSASTSHGLPGTSAAAASTAMGPPILGYQFSASSGSPESSPTTVPALTESFTGASEGCALTSMLPPSSTSRYTMATQSGSAFRSASASEEYRRPLSSYESAATLYSVSSAAEETTGRSTPAQHAGQARSDSSAAAASHHHQQTYPQLRHPQPQHAASFDELRRKSSFDQHRSTPAHRMSVSNLNVRY